MTRPGIPRRWLSPALAGALLALLASPSMAGDPAATDYRFSRPYTHANLTIYMVHGRASLAGRAPLTLQQALRSKVVHVHETGTVSQLEVENLGDEPVFIQSGDIVKGGKQDRVLSVDLILPPRSGRVPIASFCVEESRWTQRGKENAQTFSSAGTLLPSRDMKIAARAPLTAVAEPRPAPPPDGRRPQQRRDAGPSGDNQGKVWRGVASLQDKLARSVGAPVAAPQSQSSLQLSMENERLRQASEAYVAVLKDAIDREEGAIGLVFAINGRINSADIYGAPELFRRMWPKLLQASVVEALAERGEAPAAPAPSPDALRGFLVEAESGRPVTRRLGGSTTIRAHDAPKAQFLEARQADGSVVHRSYVAK